VIESVTKESTYFDEKGFGVKTIVRYPRLRGRVRVTVRGMVRVRVTFPRFNVSDLRNEHYIYI